jgi:hypothetical protein
MIKYPNTELFHFGCGPLGGNEYSSRTILPPLDIKWTGSTPQAISAVGWQPGLLLAAWGKDSWTAWDDLSGEAKWQVTSSVTHEYYTTGRLYGGVCRVDDGCLNLQSGAKLKKSWPRLAGFLAGKSVVVTDDGEYRECADGKLTGPPLEQLARLLRGHCSPGDPFWYCRDYEEDAEFPGALRAIDPLAAREVWCADWNEWRGELNRDDKSYSLCVSRKWIGVSFPRHRQCVLHADTGRMACTFKDSALNGRVLAVQPDRDVVLLAKRPEGSIYGSDGWIEGHSILTGQLLWKLEPCERWLRVITGDVLWTVDSERRRDGTERFLVARHIMTGAELWRTKPMNIMPAEGALYGWALDRGRRILRMEPGVEKVTVGVRRVRAAARERKPAVPRGPRLLRSMAQASPDPLAPAPVPRPAPVPGFYPNTEQFPMGEPGSVTCSPPGGNRFISSHVTAPLSPQWETALPESVAGISVLPGRIIVAFGSAGWAALDAANGKIHWLDASLFRHGGKPFGIMGLDSFEARAIGPKSCIVNAADGQARRRHSGRAIGLIGGQLAGTDNPSSATLRALHWDRPDGPRLMADFPPNDPVIPCPGDPLAYFHANDYPGGEHTVTAMDPAGNTIAWQRKFAGKDYPEFGYVVAARNRTGVMFFDQKPHSRLAILDAASGALQTEITIKDRYFAPWVLHPELEVAVLRLRLRDEDESRPQFCWTAGMCMKTGRELWSLAPHASEILFCAGNLLWSKDQSARGSSSNLVARYIKTGQEVWTRPYLPLVPGHINFWSWQGATVTCWSGTS